MHLLQCWHAGRLCQRTSTAALPTVPTDDGAFKFVVCHCKSPLAQGLWRCGGEEAPQLCQCGCVLIASCHSDVLIASCGNVCVSLLYCSTSCSCSGRSNVAAEVQTALPCCLASPLSRRRDDDAGGVQATLAVAMVSVEALQTPLHAHLHRVVAQCALGISERPTSFCDACAPDARQCAW
jgi:hypothetical protein